MKSFSTNNPGSHMGKTNTWLTPLWLVEALGRFDLDPCAYEKHPTAAELWKRPMNGLAHDWTGRVWLNPPYGTQTKQWLEKLQAHGNGIALVFARTDTQWYQDLKPDLTFFLSGRIKFLREDFSEGAPANQGSVLLAFGRKNAGAILSSNLKGVWLK